jgi:glycosyltransferase involved in cell wall biosynthesis
MIREEALVSILMAVYNTKFKLVKRAIDSVLAQTYKNIEIVLLDDGSNNECLQQLVNYAAVHKSKITFVQHKNVGQSISINRGIAISKGKYITILDADDEYEINHVVNCLAQMEVFDLIASTTKTIVNTEADYFVPDKYNHSKLIHVDDCILFATLFGKKEVFEKIQFENKYAADAHFFELASEKYKVGKLNLRTYIYYRNNETSLTAVLKTKNEKQTTLTYAKNEKQPI